MNDILSWADVITRAGTVKRISAAELGFSYRSSNLQPDDIVVKAAFKGTKDNPNNIRARLQDFQKQREASQPLRTRTGGSTFQNPAKSKAWQLIDAAGCRGQRVGKAYVSDKHCNFIIAEEGANASDIETLGEAVRQKVKEQFGVILEWEIKRIGRGTVC